MVWKSWIKTVWDLFKSAWKTVWDYFDNVWFKKGWKKSSLNSFDWIAWVVLTPATTIRQLITAIPNLEFENIARILVSWNKNIKVFEKMRKMVKFISYLEFLINKMNFIYNFSYTIR